MNIQEIIRKFKEPRGECFYFDLVFYQLQPEIGSFRIKIFLEDIIIQGGFSIREIKITEYKGFLEYLFPDCEIIDCQNEKGGHPDFIIKKDNEEIYLEIKIEDDGLRLPQMNWITSNKGKTIYVLFIKNSIAHKQYPSNPNSSKNFRGYPF